jgi:hypothetical protein
VEGSARLQLLKCSFEIFINENINFENMFIPLGPSFELKRDFK